MTMTTNFMTDRSRNLSLQAAVTMRSLNYFSDLPTGTVLTFQSGMTKSRAWLKPADQAAMKMVSDLAENEVPEAMQQEEMFNALRAAADLKVVRVYDKNMEVPAAALLGNVYFCRPSFEVHILEHRKPTIG